MCRRIDAFELWCWRRLLRLPWTAKRSNQSILKEISPEYSLEGLMLKLKLQSFGYLMRRTDSLEKTLMLGKIEGRRRRGRQRMRWLDSITDSMDMSLSKLRDWWWTGKPGVLQSMALQRIGHNWATELNQPNMTGISIRKGERKTDRERWSPCDDRGRDWSYASTSRGLPRVNNYTGSWERGMEEFLPCHGDTLF